METKICFKCGLEKPMDDFYKHPRMGDGHLNKCKSCTKNDTRNSDELHRSVPGWIDKERARHRDKYHRLGYKDKHRPSFESKKEIIRKYKLKYPEKQLAKNSSRTIACPDGMEKHHWSYNKEHYKDVLFISNKDHNTAHRFMVYDQERMMFRALDGILLDTKDSHLNYITKRITNNYNGKHSRNRNN